MNCGSSLGLVCTNCHAQLPPSANFCLHCGATVSIEEARREAATQADQAQDRLTDTMPSDLRTKIETARDREPFSGERRLVTALFADIVGSTALAAEMDPEQYRDIVTAAHERVSRAVYRYEGTIAQLLGDGVLAFFGAPLAHEDDAERAVRAALEIQDSISAYASQLKQRGYAFDFSMRIGLNTGTVVVGDIGNDLHTEYLAVGDAINLAARMEQTAEPGAVQISGHTHKFVAHVFEFEDLGLLEVKGKSEGIHAFRVLKVKTDADQGRGIEGLDSPLVGRELEMEQLQALVSELRQGRGQIVSVMGDAGLGKSRLVTELRKSLAAAGVLANDLKKDESGDDSEARIHWFEGRSYSYESTTPYAPFVDLLKDCLKLDLEDAEPRELERLEAAVKNISPRALSETVPYLASILGIDGLEDRYEELRFLDPPNLRSRSFRAVGDLLAEISKKFPTVVVLDDLHWVDPTSLDLLDQLLSLCDTTPLMILAIFRPRRDEPSWRFHERANRDFVHRYTAIDLQPLTQEGARELVANLLRVEDLPAKVRKLILAKAEGNPFYVEEVIRSLLDAGLIERRGGHWQTTQSIEAISVPDSLVGVITARLDRLDETARRVAQAASVIGRRFDYETLAAVHDSPAELEPALAALLRRELIAERGRHPHRAYQFKHALTQETAEASLLRRDSQALHLRVAEHLEQTRPERAGEIARHFLEAAQEARALPHLLEAGDRALRGSSSEEAMEYYRKALGILDGAGDVTMTRRAYEGLAAALTFTGRIPEAIETYQRMLRAGEAQEDAPMQVSGMNKLAMLTGVFMERFQEADEYLVDSEKLAREGQDHAGLAELHMVKCNICTATGDLEGAIAHLSESTELGEELDAEEPLLFGLTHSAQTLFFLARFEESEELAERALRVAQETGNLRYQAEVKALALPWLKLRRGEWQEADATAEQAWTLAQRIGNSVALWQSAFSLGYIARMKGEYQRAMDYQKECLRVGEMYGTAYLRMLPLCILGSTYLDISEELVEESRRHHTAVLELMEIPSAAAWGALAWAELGFCALSLGEPDQAGEYFERGLSRPSSMEHIVRPQLLVGSGLVAMASGDLDEARLLIDSARGHIEELGTVNDLPLVELADGRLASAEGDFDQALEHLGRSEETAAEMGLRPLRLNALSEAARVYDQLGKPSEAAEWRHMARGLIDEMAALFTDPELRQTFTESAIRRAAVSA